MPSVTHEEADLSYRKGLGLYSILTFEESFDTYYLKIRAQLTFQGAYVSIVASVDQALFIV